MLRRALDNLLSFEETPMSDLQMMSREGAEAAKALIRREEALRHAGPLDRIAIKRLRDSWTTVLRAGLSRKALDNPEPWRHGWLTYFEVKTGYFRLPSIRTATEEKEKYGWRFKKSKLPNYNSVSAVISRSAHLLEKRGLARVAVTERSAWIAPTSVIEDGPMHAEIRLTAKGAAAARRLRFRASRFASGHEIVIV